MARTLLVARALLVSLACAATALAADDFAQLKFHREPVVDRQQGGLVVSTIAVPDGWKITSEAKWNYQDVSQPFRAGGRVEAPDGSAWVEFFPAETFYWLEPVRSPVPVGTRSLGMIHQPNVTVQDAVNRFVVAPYRGKRKGFQVVGARPVNGLAEAFHVANFPGQAMAVRVRYAVGDKTADEDVYAFLGAGNRIPYTGPQGTWYESHRPLVLAHAVGAVDGKLQALYPVLSFIATSVQVNPMWEQRRQQVMDELSREFNRLIAQGYAQIQAAAQLSRAISANNDRMIAGMDAQRQAQAAADAARREAANAESARSTTSNFDDYIRGTERMKDPYWGESQHSYNEQHHWTDGQGNYQHSTDPSFDPNVGAGGGPTWQRMEPAGR